jgi:hypothetical protein
MWQGVRHGHETLLPWQLLSVFFLKAEQKRKRSAVNLQPRFHKTQEKMNESSGRRENRGISRTTMTSYPMPGPGIHNKSGSKPLMRNPLPFFPAQRPSLAVTSISHGLANKQTGQERNDIPITVKTTTRTLTFFFWLQTMDV